ncbi:8194_t:CDS:2, partial [Entrophospora sp. SA101]
MSAITTKIVEKYNLSSEKSVTDLSRYTSEFLKNLTDDRKRNQARRRLRDGFKFSSEQFNTISKKLFDSLGEEYGIGFVSVGAEKIYKDAIGEIKCLDLQFQYNGKWQSLDGTEVIDFQIRKNPSFDLVLGQDWLWVREAKISFEFSSKTCEHRAKIVIDGMSIPLTDEDFNKANSTKNNSPESDITLDELVDMFKKLSLRSKDNKQRKRYHSNISPVSPTPGRLNDDVSKNSGASKIKKYPKVDLENWFYGRKYNDGELQTYIPEIVTDTEDAWVRTTLRIKDLKTKKGGRVIVSVNKIINDVHNFTSDSDTSSDNDS